MINNKFIKGLKKLLFEKKCKRVFFDENIENKSKLN
jgi:hypothetical protein